ncbi:3-oxoacyl-[acyl-carrier-protein] synthase I, chloroplastic-like [Cucurbita moschata]|uniref:3-oxoacyl-[acyl-carrier-protein] synthase n=1 Tax=Cucurbita moschata TaxID=3662 RepID=A0A6J1EG88_CUCMO|nr:3-oxoacyl-[acyl-carrier-protein] synthase I, chloroplastic-like [Cucurbita moschata]
MQTVHSPTLNPSPLDPFRTRNRSPFLVGAASKSRQRVSVVAASTASTVGAPKREKDPKKRVVITGMGLVSVFGSDVDAYYDRLLCGESGITLIDRFDASKFPTRFGGQIRGFSSEGYVDPKNDKRLDDCCRFCVVAGKRALEDANLGGYQRSKINMVRAGVLIGTGFGGLTVFSNGVRTLLERGHRKITPLGFVACRALSQRNDDPKTASRPWDRDRDGFVMGEGAGILVMESLEHAMKRGAPIVGEYLGGAINCDAYHISNPRADGLCVSSCILSCLEDAGVSAEEVNYINAHATSTIAGDLAEINAIKKVFKNTSELKINATKSMIGHGLGAAGGLEAIATLKAIQKGWLHPSINQFNLEPSVDLDTVANIKQQHEVNVALSNSFGFGGHNSVVAFTAFKP